jgi:methylmalonyl-CoA mutase
VPAAEALRHDPERHPQGVHGPQHLHLSARALDADHLGHLRVHLANMPKFNSISISGYHMQEAGATPTSSSPTPSPTASNTSAPASPPASTSTSSRRACPSSGHRHELLHGGRQAARRAPALGEADVEALCAEGRPKSLSLRTHCQTSGWSLTAQDPFNNVVAHLIEAMAATQGHTQSLHTNASTRRWRCPPTSRPHRPQHPALPAAESPARRASSIRGAAQPIVERLTHDLAARALGPHRRGRGARRHGQGHRGRACPSCASRRPPPAPRRASTPAPGIVGVNKLTAGPRRAPIDVLKVDNARGARAPDRASCSKLRARDEAAVEPRSPRSPSRRAPGNGNLLALAIDAARAKATVGEISDGAGKGLRPPQGRRSARFQRRVPQASFGEDATVDRVREQVAAFEKEAEGRRPRILVAKMGQDGHDRGQKVIATAFADLGFDVDVGPLFQTPEEIAARPSRTTCTSSASPRSPPGTSRWSRNCAPPSTRLGATTS